MTRAWLRVPVAAAAALATLAIAVQFLVLEPATELERRDAGAAAARDAQVAAAAARVGAPLPPGARIVERDATGLTAGGIAALDTRRLVWVPSRTSGGLTHELRWRLLLVAASAVATVAGWALWAGATRRRLAERTAREQLEVVGMVAHDMRGPLTGITLAAERMARSEVPAACVAAQAAIARECARLNGLADDILTACAAGAAGAGATEALSFVLEDVATRVRDVHGREVIVDAAPDVGTLRTDASLARAVANATENAVRHSPPNCPISLRVVANGDVAEVVIEDDGVGFDPNFEIAAYRQGACGGRAGLGLASARRIVEGLGGSVRLGRRVGGGGAVSFRLPRQGLTR